MVVARLGDPRLVRHQVPIGVVCKVEERSCEWYFSEEVLFVANFQNENVPVWDFGESVRDDRTRGTRTHNDEVVVYG